MTYLVRPLQARVWAHSNLELGGIIFLAVVEVVTHKAAHADPAQGLCCVPSGAVVWDSCEVVEVIPARARVWLPATVEAFLRVARPDRNTTARSMIPLSSRLECAQTLACRGLTR